MYDAFLGPEPPQLTVARDRIPKAGKIVRQVTKCRADKPGSYRFDNGTANVIAASDREG
jgi:hypothetical protein